jgi:hypothetical protein
MSKLEFYSRPLVAFDPYDKDHRRYYAEFVERGSWGQCPVRFICPDEHGGDLVSLIKNNLIQYYIDREFGGGKLAIERSKSLDEQASDLYKQAGLLRKEASALKTPRRK